MRDQRSKGYGKRQKKTTRYPLPVRRQNTTHVPHDTPTHRPSHPPTNQRTQHATAIQQQTDALFRTRTSPEQVGYLAERTKYCCCTKENNSSTTHRRERTHPRTKRPLTTHPPNRPPTDQPILPPNTPAIMSYSSTAVRISWYVHQQNRGAWSVLDVSYGKHNHHGYVAPPAEYNNVSTTHSHPSTRPQPTQEPVPVRTSAC